MTEEYSAKEKRFSETLTILQNRNNELNRKYEDELKKRDELEARLYRVEQEENEKINKLTNELSQVTVMVQKQHVPRGSHVKLQES